MDAATVTKILSFIQHGVSLIGILIIISGILLAACKYAYLLVSGIRNGDQGDKVNAIRLSLGRILILGLEFIVAADLIGTITAPDYYTVGILAIIVAIRTLLSYSLNREIMDLTGTMKDKV